MSSLTVLCHSSNTLDNSIAEQTKKFWEKSHTITNTKNKEKVKRITQEISWFCFVMPTFDKHTLAEFINHQCFHNRDILIPIYYWVYNFSLCLKNIRLFLSSISQNPNHFGLWVHLDLSPLMYINTKITTMTVTYHHG